MSEPLGHEHSEEWRAILMGEAPGLERVKRLVGWMPSAPRCKLCLAPLKGVGSAFLRPFGFGPSQLNRRLCKACFKGVRDQPGGAEVELSFMFADVRGSTALAERMPAHEFSRLISRFYGVAADAVDNWNGLVDKFVGDEVVALFVPGFAGEDHASRAIAAGRDLLRETGNDSPEPWLPVGAGIHTGVAFVGRVGEGDACDFTAVGDAVNTTARLASAARQGELLVSRAAAQAAGFDATGLEARTLELRGRGETVEAVVSTA
jgi:adenylate cyclase